MRVVEWRPEHHEALERALGSPDDLCAQARPAIGPARDGPSWRFTLVAESGGEPVGAGVAFAPRWHPQRIWASVEVAAAHRREGIGSALLDAIRERCRGDGRPLRAKVFAASPGSEFAARSGFKVIQRSRIFRVERAGPALPGELVVEAPAALAVTAEAFRQFYVSSHDWDPPGPITVDDVREVHLSEAAMTMVVRDATGDVLAAGCLYDEDGALYLSGGPADPRHRHAEIAAAALIDHAPKPLLVEADDSVPAMLAALAARDASVIEEIHLVAEA